MPSIPGFSSCVYGPALSSPFLKRSENVATVALPQRSTSAVCVKNLTLKLALSDASTSAVSENPTFAAMSCFCSSVNPPASSTTPAGFPPLSSTPNDFTRKTFAFILVSPRLLKEEDVVALCHPILPRDTYRLEKAKELLLDVPRVAVS